HLDLMRRRVHRMEALIDGILQYSRAGRVRGKPETLEVGRLLHELIELVAPRPPAVVDVTGELPTLFTDRVPLQQVLMNLLTNALKHARREDVRVVVSAVEDGEFCRFTVADNGPGIAPEFHERIWGIFQTLEARDKVEGTGIGLSVVKKVVESRGGKAWVESAPGAGAKFHFTWPMKERAA
ncbi:MAG TPA: ATP-binding protein, partial [Myxococcus sp.]|nr:ATP-binding protein [Myxococcus sp.]